MRVSDLVHRLDALLDAESFEDYGPNGLQVPAQDPERRVTTVVTGVSAHGGFLREAVAAGADLVLVHHGLFWRGQPLELTRSMHVRLRTLMVADVALAAYHLPLDAHPEHGNNALLARALGIADTAPFGFHRRRAIGCRGRLPADGLTPVEFAARVQAVCGREVLHIAGGPPRLRSVGIVTGAGSDHLAEAAAAGLDALLTGEPAERAYGTALDEGVHLFAAGHHATETLGVRSLGDWLEAEHGLRHIHLDVPNPI